MKPGFYERSETKALVEPIPVSAAFREGRQRNPNNWTTFAPGTEPVLLTGRGYTGHSLSRIAERIGKHLPAFGLINMNGRFYDPVLGRFLNPDNVIQSPDFSQSYNRFTYCLNNPIKYYDPSGYKARKKDPVMVYTNNGWLKYATRRGYGGADGGDYGGGGGGTLGGPGYVWNGNGLNGIYYDWYTGGYRSSTHGNVSVGWDYSNSNVSGYTISLSAIIFSGTQSNPYENIRGFHYSDGSSFYYGDVPSGQGGGHNGTDLDPSTIGQNFLGLSYPGGNNPMTYSGDYTYSYVPTNAAEYPAIGHDRRYDRLDINGLKGLLTDPRASGADMRYVFENMAIAYFPCPGYSLTERANAWILGTGLGVMALPKTVIQLSKTNGLIEMLMWYKISNAGVTNVPSSH